MAEENEKEILTEEAVAEVAEETTPEGVAAEPVAEIKKEERPERRVYDKKRNERKPSRRPERARQEFDQKILNVRRVTRVVAGGRRFSFSVAMALGDKKGKVGVGLGKAGDTPIAVDKAVRAAKKSMMMVSLKNQSISHPVEAKYASARVIIMPAPGKGVVAGSSVRTILELAGIREVSAKILSRSKNKINNARAAMKALQQLKKEKMERSKN